MQVFFSLMICLTPCRVLWDAPRHHGSLCCLDLVMAGAWAHCMCMYGEGGREAGRTTQLLSVCIMHDSPDDGGQKPPTSAGRHTVAAVCCRQPRTRLMQSGFASEPRTIARHMRLAIETKKERGTRPSGNQCRPSPCALLYRIADVLPVLSDASLSELRRCHGVETRARIHRSVVTNHPLISRPWLEVAELALSPSATWRRALESLVSDTAPLPPFRPFHSWVRDPMPPPALARSSKGSIHTLPSAAPPASHAPPALVLVRWGQKDTGEKTRAKKETKKKRPLWYNRDWKSATLSTQPCPPTTAAPRRVGRRGGDTGGNMHQDPPRSVGPLGAPCRLPTIKRTT